LSSLTKEQLLAAGAYGTKLSLNFFWVKFMGNGPEFFQTRMGQQYYEQTLPNLVKAIEHLATAIDKQNQLKQN
jgi:hypothetical protein